MCLYEAQISGERFSSGFRTIQKKIKIVHLQYILRGTRNFSFLTYIKCIGHFLSIKTDVLFNFL